ncbi:PIN domain nuclease of toxin-antitoxin system [Amycolatopsis sulphurea]|uniref:PIN domain nuclease of toxin-antitoxin system n=1 Tax=Amycolatopsis sulphurea TaxID=76022 RepID=A0A2A9FZX3_9PSEU|nr:type II toxin-antitoxin system VapC family toxin [Amycolatopsis sulphurea]PFG57027.1 PIN domain nuclease of toxin-antitoxin system [Amycolatopsis sulphurea]
MTAVLDASAVLALIYREDGHEQVAAQVRGAVISAVNFSEVVQKLAQNGHPTPTEAAGVVLSLGATVAAFTAAEAVDAALLWAPTRGNGLSFGDRACLAVAASIPGGRAVTADKAWARVDVGVPVDLIR